MFDRVICSDLIRATDTLKGIINNSENKNQYDVTEYDPRIREITYGIFEGNPLSEFIEARDSSE